MKAVGCVLETRASAAYRCSFSLDGFLMPIKEKIKRKVEEKTNNSFIPNYPFPRHLEKAEHY